MGYQEELNRLMKIITSDNSSEEQRESARKAKDKLIDNSIDAAFKKIEERTQVYGQLVEKLKGIINNIAANQLTTVMEDLDAVAKEIIKTADGS